MSKLRCLVVFAVLACSGCDSTGDRLEVPIPDQDRYVAMELSCIHATSSKDVVVGGFLTDVDGGLEGIVLQTTDAGKNWRRIGALTFPFEGFLPQTVYFNDLLRGWVSGIRVRRGETIPSVIRTENGGGHWRESQIPENRAAIVVAASELLFESDEFGEVHVSYQDLATGLPRINLYETRDGGKNWVLGKFIDEVKPKISDTARFFITDQEGFRLEPPLPNGTQVLNFTGSAGEAWIPLCQFHVSQFAQFY
ncbi:MAG: photosystem II stability/assembly factor-like uncharacterized protein [Planctomycetota bacterium]|jgi:photosystem II stability/assembly factor-like uncharacterized protein